MRSVAEANTDGPRSPGLVILAGGAGARCGGVDKGWLEIGGDALVEHCLRNLADCGWEIALSANRNLERYRALGLRVLVDSQSDFPGPLAGISAALHADLGTPLLTVPVDTLQIPPACLRSLLDASDDGRRPVYAVDGDGPQPLIAVWPSDSVVAVDAALRSRRNSVRDLQGEMGAVGIRFPGVRFRNINTLSDLDGANAAFAKARTC